jgi:hypothetical protein
MHPQIKRRLNTIRESGEAVGRHPDTTDQIQRIYLKAMEGRSKASAIKAFCVECFGYDKGYARSIRECADQGCPLYRHRPYKAHSSPKNGQERGLESTISENMPCG